MSSLTSLSINKNSTRFTPKLGAKKRTARKPVVVPAGQSTVVATAEASSSNDVRPETPATLPEPAIERSTEPPNVAQATTAAQNIPPPLRPASHIPRVPVIAESTSVTPVVEESNEGILMDEDKSLPLKKRKRRRLVPEEEQAIQQESSHSMTAEEHGVFAKENEVETHEEDEMQIDDEDEKTKGSRKKRKEADDEVIEIPKTPKTPKTPGTDEEEPEREPPVATKKRRAKSAKGRWDEEEYVDGAVAPGFKKRGKKRTDAQEESEEEDDAAKQDGEEANRKPKKRRKGKQKATAVGTPIATPIATPIDTPGQFQDENSKPADESNQKKEQTEEYDPSKLETLDDINYDPAREEYLDKPISYFLKDTGQGIVSKAFKEYEMERVLKKKAAQKEDGSGNDPDSERITKELEAAKKKKEEEARMKQEEEKRRQETATNVLQETSNAPQFRMINGEIVLDTESLVIGGRREPEEPVDMEGLEVVEETGMTKRVNSATHGRKKQSARWTKIETEKFYEALAQFGTDFQMMCYLLPGRTRAQIRTKFNREERINPEKIKDYLIGKKQKIDLQKLQEATGEQFAEAPEGFELPGAHEKE